MNMDRRKTVLNRTLDYMFNINPTPHAWEIKNYVISVWRPDEWKKFEQIIQDGYVEKHLNDDPYDASYYFLTPKGKRKALSRIRFYDLWQEYLRSLPFISRYPQNQ